jgi:hypothetical protein
MTVLRVAAAAALVLGAVSETARADSQPTGTTEEAGFQSQAPGAVIVPPSATPAPDPFVAPPTENDGSSTGSAQFVEGDARSGQAWATPTAFTTPKGHATIQSWTPALPIGGVVIASYGVTSRVEIGAGALFAVEEMEDGGLAGVVHGKVQVFRTRRAAISVQGYYAKIPDDETITTVSAVGSTCLGARCRTVASVHLTGVPIGEAYDDNGNPSEALLVVAGGSIITGGRTKLVFEALTFQDGPDQFVIAYGGVRLARRTFSADLGLVALNDGDDMEFAPVPLLGLGARF